MKKTMYIPKGKECHYESLTCDNIIVEGSLRVDGEIRSKHIRGKGFLCANVISAKTVTACAVDAGTVVCDRLIAERVAAVEVHAVESAAISCYIEADLVKAGKITLADAAIADLVADEIIQLKPKNRGLLGTLFASYIRAKWTALFYRAPKEAKRKAKTAEQQAEQPAEAQAPEFNVSPIEAAEVETLLNDPEFLRLKAMYRLSQQMDYIWQLRPKQEPTDRAVTLAGHQFAAVAPEEKVAA